MKDDFRQLEVGAQRVTKTDNGHFKMLLPQSTLKSGNVDFIFEKLWSGAFGQNTRRPLQCIYISFEALDQKSVTCLQGRQPQQPLRYFDNIDRR